MQHTREQAPRRLAFRRREAAGRKINLLGFVALLVAGYVGWVLLTPEITAYELKGSMATVCRKFLTWHFAGRPETIGYDGIAWEKDWNTRFRRLGLNLREDQWEFRPSPDCHEKRGCVCTGEAVFELTTPWFLLEDFVDIPPYKSTHHVIKDVEWRTKY